MESVISKYFEEQPRKAKQASVDSSLISDSLRKEEIEKEM